MIWSDLFNKIGNKTLTEISGIKVEDVLKILTKILTDIVLTHTIEPKRIESVNFNDFLGWYKSKHILDGDVAVLADFNKINSDNVGGSSKLSEKISKDDKCLLLAIVDKKKSKIKEYELLISDNFDKKIIELLGKEPLVILE